MSGQRPGAGPAAGEDALLAWLRRREPELERWLGDDAARLAPAGERAVTVDSQIEGVHFPPGLDPALAARRLLAVNLSDLAAVGARPDLAFLALSAPRGFDHRRFFRAFLAACSRFGVQLAGGDLATTGTLTLSLTLIGYVPPGHRWLARSAAGAEQALWVGGTLGESAAGRLLLAAGAKLDGRTFHPPPSLALPAALCRAARRAVERHLLPRPQLELGSWLARRKYPVAAIDLSDGLARDLRRLCAASGVGARIERSALPAPQELPALADALGEDTESLMLTGGEDYVLLFTLPPRARPPQAWPCRRIGRTSSGGAVLWGKGGHLEPLPQGGWDHLAPAGH